MKKQIKYIILEEFDDNEAFITYIYNKKDIDNYESLYTGKYIVLSINAFNNLVKIGLGQ